MSFHHFFGAFSGDPSLPPFPQSRISQSDQAKQLIERFNADNL